MKDPFGVLVVDKPVGPTSHKVVSIVRKGTRARKVGHTGTLDPRASGVLVLCLGAATRLSEYLAEGRKEYEAVVRFGIVTDTYDADGRVLETTDRVPSLEEIKSVLPEFEGQVDQTPPVYSAIRVKGKRAYELARSGEDVEMESRPVDIYALEALTYQPPDFLLRVECSSGTYIRSLAHDLGQRLSAGAHLAALRRSRSGHFGLEQAVALSELERGFNDGSWREHLIPAAESLPDFPKVRIASDQVSLVRNGHSIPADGEAEGLARGITPNGTLAAILEAVSDGEIWHPVKVFLP